jgi:hypothetical protein
MFNSTPCKVCGKTQAEVAALEKQLQVAQMQEVRLQKCLDALKEA